MRRALLLVALCSVGGGCSEKQGPAGPQGPQRGQPGRRGLRDRKVRRGLPALWEGASTRLGAISLATPLKAPRRARLGIKR